MSRYGGLSRSESQRRMCCMMKSGDKVKIEYKGTLKDGTVFDSSEKQGKPLEFEIGAQQVIQGFEDAIKTMKQGEEKKITLEPKDAYGEHDERLIKSIPRDQLPKDQEPKEGMVLLVTLPNKQQIPAVITKVENDNVTIDINHPLAGKTLNFDLKLVGVVEKK